MSIGNSSEEILALSHRAQDLMQRHGVLPSPENYELWYAYAAQRNEALVGALDQAVRGGKASDLDHARVLHARFFARGSSEVQEVVGNQLAAEIAKLAEALQSAGADTAEFGRTLTSAGSEMGGAKPDMKAILEKVSAATRTVEARNRSLEAELQTSVSEVAILREKMETVRKESLSDALTGLANRRCFDDRVREAAIEARHAGKPLSLIMGDIDNFKRFNDAYGHATGDQVLRLVAQCFSSNVRGCDTAARFGGEEFVVVMPGTALADASVVADQIRSTVETKKIVKRSSGETMGSITLSLGVAQFAPGEDLADLINRADACLYAAKRGGRNRVLTQAQLSAAAPATRTSGVGEKPAASKRSTASLSFEYAVRALCRSGEVALRSEIDLRHFHRFARWMVIAEPDLEARRLPMRLVGSGFFELFGRDLTDTDYLALVEPASQAHVFDHAVEMLRRPCGFWQQTPVATARADTGATFEYTAFPIYDDRQKKGQLIVHVNHGFSETTGFPSGLRIQTSAIWDWIDLGAGVPKAA